MATIFSILINPVTVSVLVLCALCLTGLNVLLSMLIACIIGGVAGGIPLLSAPEGTQTVMQLLTGGFASNATTALAYILLGTFATCISTTGLAEILSKKLSRLLGGHRLALIGVLTLVACLSQNLIPVHIAYIPILVPPLLGMMNRMRLDRRAVACALAFGHKVPYITIPFGFGLIFQRVIADNLTENGLSVTVRDVTAANWSIGIAMLLGLLAAVFVLYRRPREYCDLEADTSASEEISEKLEYRHYVMLGAAIVVAVVQVISQDLALSALCGLVVIVVFRAIKWNEIDAQVEGGIRLMRCAPAPWSAEPLIVITSESCGSCCSSGTVSTGSVPSGGASLSDRPTSILPSISRHSSRQTPRMMVYRALFYSPMFLPHSG